MNAPAKMSERRRFADMRPFTHERLLLKSWTPIMTGRTKEERACGR